MGVPPVSFISVFWQPATVKIIPQANTNAPKNNLLYITYRLSNFNSIGLEPVVGVVESAEPVELVESVQSEL